MGAARAAVLAAVLALAARGLASAPPGASKGPTAGRPNTGTRFDHWNDHAFNGAVSQVCAGNGKYHLSGISVCYAGSCASAGKSAREACWDLQQGETIVALDVQHGDKHGPGIFSVKFHSSMGRTWQYGTAWSGHEATWAYWKPNDETRHLVAMYGSADDYVDSLGVYWGTGNVATGQWQPVQVCPGCGPTQYTYKRCTTESTGHTKTVTDAWSRSVQTEISEGFTFEGLFGGGSIKETQTWSKTVVTQATDSFTAQTCESISFQCDQNLWQFSFSSNFDEQGQATTWTPYKVCTDKVPCCLPLTFSSDPTVCDLQPHSPNTCGNKSHLRNATV